MADVNEEILEQYLKVVKNWLYATDIQYRVTRGHGNIDVLGYDPVANKYYDFEVKFRSAATIPNNGKSVNYFVQQFSSYQDFRENKLKEYIGKKIATKVIVTTYQMVGKSISKRSDIERDYKKAMKKAGFYRAQIWYFDDIIPELVESTSTRGRHNTQLLQTIRMLKTYGVEKT